MLIPLAAPVPLSTLERQATFAGLLRLAVPLAAGPGLGFLLHFVNRMFLAWHSPEALAASLPAGMLAWTIQCCFVASASYVGVFAAQHVGAGEHQECGAMLWPMVWLGLGAWVVSLALIPAIPLAVDLMAVRDPPVAKGMSELCAWYLAETGPVVLMSGAGAFAGGLGRTGLVLGLAAAGAVTSIVLNYWLIFGGLGVPALGISGAGLATLLTSVIFTGVWAAVLFAPGMRRQFHTWSERNIQGARLVRFFRYALPRGATEVLEMVAFLVFTAAIARYGTKDLAAFNLAFSTYLLLAVPMIGFCNGLGVAVGQAVGAGRPDLARKSVTQAVRLTLLISLGIAVLFVLLPRPLLELLVQQEQSSHTQNWSAILSAAAPLLTLFALLYPLDILQFVWRTGVQAAGDTRWPLILLVGSAVLLMALPVWLVTRMVSVETFAAWGLSPVTTAVSILIGQVAIVAAALWARFTWGPWPTMSVRT
jgi:MATE family multidrug resistance protein